MEEEPRVYTVGWICALTCEYIAARNLLDEKHGDAIPSQGDSNSYTLGSMGSHNLVIACLPKGRIGNVSAASVASDMLRSFESIRFGLMVGIGGGAPTTENDIRLGDVVVSSPDRQVGGVLHYKFGKEIQNREFELTGSLAPPPAILLSALNQLSAQHVEEGHRIAESIEQMVTRAPNLRNYFQRPPPDEDRLYNANHVHTNDMRPDERSQLVIRQPRTDKNDDPAIHYGLITSADQVMKDAHTRDKLVKEQGILCFEMEAAGLMDRFACVVIRGICDYSNTHKSSNWQHYAAATAAAYAKELLAVIAGDKVYKMVPLSGDMHHEKVLKAVVPALKSSIDGLVKKVDTLGASADEQKEALANTSKALDEIHKGLSLLNEAQSDYKEKLNTLAENQAEKKSIEQVSDQLKHIQSSQEGFAKSLETLTRHIQVKQEESPSKDWDSLSDKAKEQKVDLEQMASITAGTIKEGSEIAGKFGVSQKFTNKVGGVGEIFGTTSKIRNFVKRFHGDKGEQRPSKPKPTFDDDQVKQRPPPQTRQSTSLNEPRSSRHGLAFDADKQRPPLPPRQSASANVQRSDKSEQRPPPPPRQSAPADSRAKDIRTTQKATPSIPPLNPASPGPTSRPFDSFIATSNHQPVSLNHPATTSNPPQPIYTCTKSSSSGKRPAGSKPPRPPKPLRLASHPGCQ